MLIVFFVCLMGVGARVCCGSQRETSTPSVPWTLDLNSGPEAWVAVFTQAVTLLPQLLLSLFLLSAVGCGLQDTCAHSEQSLLCSVRPANVPA